MWRNRNSYLTTDGIKIVIMVIKVVNAPSISNAGMKFQFVSSNKCRSLQYVLFVNLRYVNVLFVWTHDLLPTHVIIRK